MANKSDLAGNILWNYLKNRRLGGYNFEEKSDFGSDDQPAFYCQEVRVIVRIGRPELDEELAWQKEMISFHQLLQKGMILLSFHPEHVIRQIDFVLSQILGALHERSLHWKNTVVQNN